MEGRQCSYCPKWPGHTAVPVLSPAPECWSGNHTFWQHACTYWSQYPKACTDWFTIHWCYSCYVQYNAMQCTGSPFVGWRKPGKLRCPPHSGQHGLQEAPLAAPSRHWAAQTRRSGASCRLCTACLEALCPAVELHDTPCLRPMVPACKALHAHQLCGAWLERAVGLPSRKL